MMDMRSYHKEFTHYEKIFQENRKLSIECFIDEIQIIEERIGFQFSLHESVAKTVNEDDIAKRFVQKPISQEAKLILGAISMFQINNKNLYSAFESTLFDLVLLRIPLYELYLKV